MCVIIRFVISVCPSSNSKCHRHNLSIGCIWCNLPAEYKSFRPFFLLLLIFPAREQFHSSLDLFPWYSLDILLIFPWYSLDIPLIFPWYSLDIPLIFSWYSLDIPLIFPWYSLDILLIFSWYSLPGTKWSFSYHWSWALAWGSPCWCCNFPAAGVNLAIIK